MRTLTQPGPIDPVRIDMVAGEAETMAFDTRPGQTLHEALTGPMIAAGFQAGTIELTGGAFNPFRYVMPGPPDNETHVAYFTAPNAPIGETLLERANATFGWADGQPFLHCHAVWIEPDGRRRGGHILPREAVFSRPGAARAWGFRDVRIETGLDRETNFTLFGVRPNGAPNAFSTAGAVAARVRPNIDIARAVEAIAQQAGMRDATIRGSLGSLVGASFADGRAVDDLATEVLVRSGQVRDGKAELDLAVIDMDGQVHDGVLALDRNAVLITFDVILSRNA